MYYVITDKLVIRSSCILDWGRGHLFSSGSRPLTLTCWKVTSLCHQYTARLACKSVKSGQALYCWLAKFKLSSYILKYSENGKRTHPFNSKSMARTSCASHFRHRNLLNYCTRQVGQNCK